MSADSFCRSIKLSSALREESRGKRGGKERRGRIITNRAHPCWFDPSNSINNKKKLTIISMNKVMLQL